jgi:hypothetical protein
MEPELKPRITAAERGSRGILITFADGRCAFYSAALLDSMFPHAEQIPEEDDAGVN